MTYDKIVWLSIDSLRCDCISSNTSKLYPKEYKKTIKLKKSKLDEICKKGFFLKMLLVLPLILLLHMRAILLGCGQKTMGFTINLTAN
jgi:hypothetical protein